MHILQFMRYNSILFSYGTDFIYQVRHCVSVNVRALISVILAIGTKTMWKRIRDCIYMFMTERAQQAVRNMQTVHVWTKDIEQSEILNAPRHKSQL